MSQPHFVFSYLPFWITIYALSAVAWTCLGRFILGLFVSPNSSNYIWRFFRLLSDWAVTAADFITPRIVPRGLLAPIAALWLFVARVVASIVMLAAGLAPSLTNIGGGPH